MTTTPARAGSTPSRPFYPAGASGASGALGDRTAASPGPSPAGDPAERGRPGGYRLVVPDDWWRIDLEPARRGGSVRALTERQFRGRDELAALRRQTEADLLRQAEDGWRTGGIELYLAMTRIGAGAVSASLLTSFLPPPDGGPGGDSATSPEELAARLAPDPDRGAAATVSLVELPAGWAVRRRSRTARPAAEGEPPLYSVGLSYYLAVPAGAGSYLLLSFSTPVEVLGDALVELFDAVAATVRWVW